MFLSVRHLSKFDMEIKHIKVPVTITVATAT